MKRLYQRQEIEEHYSDNNLIVPRDHITKYNVLKK